MQKLLALFARANLAPAPLPPQPMTSVLSQVILAATQEHMLALSETLLSIGLVHRPFSLSANCVLDEAHFGCDALFLDADCPDSIRLLDTVVKTRGDRIIIALGSEASLAVSNHFLERGTLDHLVLPISPEHLAHRLERALALHRSGHKNRTYQRSLEQYAHAQSARMEELYLTTITALANTLDLRDPHTHGHSARVAEWSRRLALHIGLSPNTVRDIVTGAALHDIGKLAIPDAVLLKPDRLTRDEYELIKTHSIVGWRLLSPILSHAPEALNIVRWHHERLDASGYPDNLPDKNIPLEARLVGIADTFDAMTMGRPYAVARTPEQALSVLEAEAGKLFDPELVAAMRILLQDTQQTPLAPAIPTPGQNNTTQE